MPDQPLPRAARSERDPRLDVFRGLALVMIFINHVPGTIYENFTSRNFGFSDAAEGFVLMSGVSAGLAYGMSFRAPPYWPGLSRVWGRVWTLYLVHLMISVWALAIAATAALHFGAVNRLFLNEINFLFESPLAFLIGLPLMTLQLGYINILPLYAVLMFCAPLMLWVALRKPWALLAFSILLWVVAGFSGWNFPSYPKPGGWFFNPLTWQIVFIFGIVTGVELKQGRRLVPIRRDLQWISGIYLLISALLAQIHLLGDAFNTWLWQALQDGWPRFITTIDKMHETWPRLLHILALGYLLSTLGWVRTAAASRFAAPLALLGRHSLPVFACGSLLALTGQSIKEVVNGGFALDSAIIFAGLLIQLALAWARERHRQSTRKAAHRNQIPTVTAR
ncbi:OpgC domain-containing protein [Tabrizicola sp. J26]|uniref:OpgC family protein n=1 Tax=Alitabrizicola rongguiensis TaxID=2909234 RepID=UPI001F1EE70D|nr:OpgC domain-containing protein [Tabrizicola rongguiensis]MCF1709231.1 OpgC domain-containing protein [Tabrizicola rongguiensis]